MNTYKCNIIQQHDSNTLGHDSNTLGHDSNTLGQRARRIIHHNDISYCDFVTKYGTTEHFLSQYG